MGRRCASRGGSLMKTWIANRLRSVFVLLAIAVSLSSARHALATCSAAITALRVYDAPDAYQVPYVEVDYALVGSPGQLVIYVNDVNWANGNVSGSGTFGAGIPFLLAAVAP